MKSETLTDALRRKSDFFKRVEGGHNETELLLKNAAATIELQEQVLNKVRKYAEERERYGRAGRIVGSARIASDLLHILRGAPGGQ